MIGAFALAAGGPACARGLEAGAGVQPVSSRLGVETVRFAGRTALRVYDRPVRAACCLVNLNVRGFHDGTIEALIAGRPLPDAPAGSRGFIGIAFRVEAANRYEAFYLRPTNGRADDQLRRNHATQYVSEPEFPWERLRQETPGVYESYADIQPGIWTHVRIEVAGNRARLYLDHGAQPVLIVNDLKHGATAAGGIALWIGDGTDGYFADVRVTPRTTG